MDHPLVTLFSRVPVPDGACVDPRKGLSCGESFHLFESPLIAPARCDLSARQALAEFHRSFGQCPPITDPWKSSALCEVGSAAPHLSTQDGLQWAWPLWPLTDPSPPSGMVGP